MGAFATWLYCHPGKIPVLSAASSHAQAFSMPLGFPPLTFHWHSPGLPVGFKFTDNFKLKL